jgi:glycosyltransferase involved in cell wall biosynthesis
VVGQGPPAIGGIPTFVGNLIASSSLRQAASLAFVNTTPGGARRPGAITTTNLIRSIGDAVRVFRAARRADVVHLNVSAAPTAPLGRALLLAAAARGAGARTILHAHTGRLHLAARGRLYRWLLRRSSLVIDAFVVVSRIEADAARAVGLDPEVIPNGLDVTRFPTGPKDDPPLIAFVGTVCERKGLIDLLGALSHLRREGASPFRVEIVGDASQEGPGVFERIRLAYRRAGLDGVVFRGVLDRNGVDDVLARASIFCLPSHWEGLPLSLLEAMAAEAAPIATTVGEIPWMLDDGRAGVLVGPRDVTGLGAALRELIEEPDRRAALGAAARRRVQERYGEPASFEALAALYRRLAGYSR